MWEVKCRQGQLGERWEGAFLVCDTTWASPSNLCPMPASPALEALSAWSLAGTLHARAGLEKELAKWHVQGSVTAWARTERGEGECEGKCAGQWQPGQDH